ncbi:D-alanine aminotransferase [Salmonella enterica subsp. enterica serovar Choleraesuis]|nr:D-alanine aminotransferase [Salmonella enterica subsp. enterica serovar Choleraesuis]
MERQVWINGQWCDEQQAQVSVFDRGFLFADAVYEVTAVIDGRPIAMVEHLARLRRSCDALGLRCPLTDSELRELHLELISRNNLREGSIYMQLTRGGNGDRVFTPPENITPTLVLFSQAQSVVNHPAARHGIRVVTCPDIRWGRCDIKTTGLLAASMAKMMAHQLGVDDALLVREGLITEGASSNVFIVTQRGDIVTRHLGRDILPGITRQALLALVAESGNLLSERAFTPQEARRAQEVFISSATTLIWPVIEIDGQPVGNGRPGPVAQRLRALYLQAVRAS